MRRSLLALGLLAACTLVPAFAQNAGTQPALPAWDQLTPAQRELLIAPTRDRWNREPERRQQFMDFATRWQSLPPDQRNNARRGMQRWEAMTPQQQDQARALFHATRNMSRDARRDFMENWRNMTPQQRTDWVKAHPAPPGGPAPPLRGGPPHDRGR